MGWWTIEGTDDLVGDDAFDIVRDAFVEVARLYESEFDRVPTRREWEVLLRDGLMPLRHPESERQLSLFADNAIPTTVSIVVTPTTTDD